MSVLVMWLISAESNGIRRNKKSESTYWRFKILKIKCNLDTYFSSSADSDVARLVILSYSYFISILY